MSQPKRLCNAGKSKCINNHCHRSKNAETQSYKMQYETADFAPGVATWRTRWNICFVFDILAYSAHYSVHAPFRDESSTKPEVHDVLHCRHRRTETRPQVTCIANFVKFRYVVFKICEQTDRKTVRQTNIQTLWSQYLAYIPGQSKTPKYKKLNHRRGTARHAMSAEILTTAAKLYEKSHLK